MTLYNFKNTQSFRGVSQELSKCASFIMFNSFSTDNSQSNISDELSKVPFSDVSAASVIQGDDIKLETQSVIDTSLDVSESRPGSSDNYRPVEMLESTDSYSDSDLSESQKSSISLDDLSEIEAVPTSTHSAYLLYAMGAENQTKYDDIFRADLRRSQKNSVVQRDFNWLKSPNDASILRNLNVVYFQAKVWNNMNDLFRTLRFPTTLQPVARMYINSAGANLSRTMASSLITNLAPSVSDTVGKVGYGLSTGASDLLAFICSKESKMKYKYNWSSDVQKPIRSSLRLFKDVSSNPDTDTPDLDLEVVHKSNSFKVTSGTSIYQFLSRHSGYSSDTWRYSISKVANINVCLSYRTSETAVSERHVFVLKGQAVGQPSTYADTFSSSLVTNVNPDIRITDKCIIDQVMSLFFIREMLEKKTILRYDNGLEEILNYLGSTIMSYLFNQLTFKQNVHPVDAAIEINVDRLVNSEEGLISSYQNLVNDGCVVPMTPLQATFYEGSQSMDDWKGYSAFGALANPTFNKILLSVCPSIDSESKRNFIMVVRNSSYLKSSWYHQAVTTPGLTSSGLRISKNTYIADYMKGILACGDIPSSLYFNWRGDWEGSSSSPKVRVAWIHPVLCKYYFSEVDELYQTICTNLIYCSSHVRESRYSYVLMNYCMKVFSVYLSDDGVDPTCNAATWLDDSELLDSVYNDDRNSLKK